MLKQFGFKWNRNKKCWYTKRNSDTLIVLENLQNQYKLIGQYYRFVGYPLKPTNKNN